MGQKTVRITHRPSGIVIAEGPIGWGFGPIGDGVADGLRLRHDHLELPG